MSFLPIVDRELRMAARRKSTYRIRWWTTIAAIVVCLFLLIFASIATRLGGIGQFLFSFLTFYAFGLCLLAGIFLTADCVSEEKREGTLGLLFLTDLRGYDVVLGKFAAMSLNPLYALLAILPIIGMPLLMGGVTAGEFWRVALALANTLFVSLAAGIFVSTFNRDSQKAMGGTLGVLVLLLVGLPLLESFRFHAGVLSWCSVLAWASPYYPFSHALEQQLYLLYPGRFWGAVVVSHFTGWLLLAMASLALPRWWQESGEEKAAGKLACWLRGKRDPARRARDRARLSENPLLWLVMSDPAIPRLAWGTVIVCGSLVAIVILVEPRHSISLAFGMLALNISGFLFKCLLIVQICRFFIESRRNGALEMILCTPLKSQDILRGQSMALRRTLLPPMAVLLGIFLAAPFISLLFTLTRSGRGAEEPLFLLFQGGWYTLQTVCDFLAIQWFGLWLALTMRRPTYAVPLIVVLVLIIPSIPCFPKLLADLFFILYGYNKLDRDLRWLLARQSAGEHRFTLAPVPAPPGVPPVIGSRRGS